METDFLYERPDDAVVCLLLEFIQNFERRDGVETHLEMRVERYHDTPIRGVGITLAFQRRLLSL